MKRLMLFTALLICACAGTEELAPRQDRTAYVGAMVRDGAAFRPRDIVVAGDRIVDEPAGSADHRVELDGGYVVPPFCEAHNHNLGALFPDRSVGSLDPGNEASFVALGADPLANFDAVRNIRLRVKQGAALEV